MSVDALERYIGRGILTPFRRDRKNDFANGSGAALLKSRVEQLFGMELGEFRPRPSLGTRFYLAKHRHLASVGELLRVWGADALRRHEPNLEVLSTEASFNGDTRELTVRFTIGVVNRGAPGGTLIDAFDVDHVLPAAA